MNGALDPEARRRVNDLFHQALELTPAERPIFVRKACDGASAVADEVLSLLAAHEQTGQFLHEPVSTAARKAAAEAEAASRLVGRTVGQYHVDRILGQGGMGVVYQATDLRLGRVVALKAISPDAVRDEARRERLRREARAAASLTHPGIAMVHALEEFGGDLFIVGEFVPGETLRDELHRGPVNPAALLQTTIELAQALAAAHDHGVVHRDLKPENVIRTPSGQVKILDFGLARMRETPGSPANLTQDGTLFGTPGYMSPEQLRYQSVDGRSDLFSLGVMLYELMTGEHPFAGAVPSATIINILEKEPRPFRASAGQHPSTGNLVLGLEAIIRTLLRKMPEARFASAHQLIAALDRVRGGSASIGTLSGGEGRLDALGWWRFHQVATITFYSLMLIPTWLARHELKVERNTSIGLPIFVIAVVAVVGAITLRMHLRFAATSLPDEFAHQLRTSAKWVRSTDLLFVGAVLSAAFALLWDTEHTVLPVILIIGAVIALIVAAVIEPATTRAAFGRGN